MKCELCSLSRKSESDLLFHYYAHYLLYSYQKTGSSLFSDKSFHALARGNDAFLGKSLDYGVLESHWNIFRFLSRNKISKPGSGLARWKIPNKVQINLPWTETTWTDLDIFGQIREKCLHTFWCNKVQMHHRHQTRDIQYSNWYVFNH